MRAQKNRRMATQESPLRPRSWTTACWAAEATCDQSLPWSGLLVLANRVGVGNVDEFVTTECGAIVGVHGDVAANHGSRGRVRGDGERYGAGLAGSQRHRRVGGTGVDGLRPDVASTRGDGAAERA